MMRRGIVLLAALWTSACALPRWPVEGSLSSPYGVRMSGWRPRIHHGVDIPLPVGTPVRAMAPGRVVHSGWIGGYGTTVIVEHGGGTATLYAHLSEAAVASGARVEGRQVIGLSGRSGNVTGPHLHFEVRRRGRSEDPVPLLGGPPRRR